MSQTDSGETIDERCRSKSTLPMWRPTYPQAPVGSRPERWLQNCPHKRAALPQEGAPFTPLAVDERFRREAIDGAIRNGVIVRVGWLKPYRHSDGRKARSSRTSLYQLSEDAYNWFKDHETSTSVLPCDCESTGFVNLGTVEDAPFDETYYSCKSCGRAFPESDVEE